MIESNNVTNISGNWKITVDTPFGKEQYSLNIENAEGNLSGSVSHEKGSSAFRSASFEHNTFHCSMETEFPIKATVSITADLIEGNKLAGTLQIDQHLITSFVGAK